MNCITRIEGRRQESLIFVEDEQTVLFSVRSAIEENRMLAAIFVAIAIVAPLLFFFFCGF